MRIFALTVGRNEEMRYLDPMLRHLRGFVDEHFFYDDQSDDETVKLAFAAGCFTCIRPDEVPSFVENEGAFREGAWRSFEQCMKPAVGDWVLVIDCDEVLVSTQVPISETLYPALKWTCENTDKIAVDLEIPEVFGFVGNGVPLIRKDGAWPSIHAPRLFQYRSGGFYFGQQGSFGVPAVPQYVMRGPWASTELLKLMHYGYADERDQRAKYERYNGVQGHGGMHVRSIISPDKVLEPWQGPYVKDMRRD